MKRAPLVLVAAGAMLGPRALADGIPAAFTTDFDVAVVVGGNTFHMAIPTGQGLRFALPAAFSSWNCRATNKFMSNDGSEYYVNVICDPVGHDGVVGVSITCPTRAPGSYVANFFLRSVDATGAAVDATMAGSCTTHAPRSPQTTGQRL